MQLTEPRHMFDGFNNADYEQMMPFIVGHETQQTKLIAGWMMEHLQPESVIDIGCGPGNYLTAFPEEVEKFGVDACRTAGSLLTPEEFLRHDLRYPFCPNKRYDLAIFMEVGEHFHPHWAERLIDTVWDCSQTVLLSWAVPGQGGTDHFNELPVQTVLDMFHERHGYMPHPLNDAWRNYVESQPDAFQGPDVPEGVIGVTGWLKHNSYLLYTPEPWVEPAWVNEQQPWLGNITWREYLSPEKTLSEPNAKKRGRPKKS